ncbi:phosphoketolase family protein [Synechococcus elongatus]|uniref:phosphoketolase family protein n=1 Tax=Synechococcus elongatus TaxID=32046 RepID=UPI0030CDA32C
MTSTLPATDIATLSPQEQAAIDAWWRAANYLSVGQIYLRDNPLLQEPLRPEHIKQRLLGHWGSDPGLSFVYVHLNRLIRLLDLNLIYVTGPGHGAPALLANAWLEGTYSEVYPNCQQSVAGLQQFFKQFSFPGGIGSHCTPETPGSIHEGGELGYSLSHAFGAALDNPDLIVACVIGDGEAETGPLATSWHSNKFLNPAQDGAVLPILHLNGYKIANPTLLSRISHEELRSLFVGYGYEPFFVEGNDPAVLHGVMASTLATCVQKIQAIQAAARSGQSSDRPMWPMIVLRTPKGWTGPATIKGHVVEGSWRSHQVPMSDVLTNPEHLKLLEDWLRSYRPEELFDATGAPAAELQAIAPLGDRRMSANPVTNGGLLRRALTLPDFHDQAVAVPAPGKSRADSTRPLGQFLREVIRHNPDNFRMFGPDETASNRLDAVYEVTSKVWLGDRIPEDEDGGHLSDRGRVMEILSEHTLEGWLEAYLLTGRHGFFATYEAFAHVIDSMVNQHAKWLDVSKREVSWRAPVSSLNILLSSTVWRQDHNGFSHQDPGFIDLVTNKSARVTRIYLPPDANCLLSVADHCLRSTDYINVIVADKQSHLQYLDAEAAARHCAKGIGIWDWASNDQGSVPDVVIASCGDVVTLEALAATALLREHFPDLKIRFVNVVDLFRLQPDTEHPHGLSDRDFDSLFTVDKPIIFNFHGYPWLIHKLAYRRRNHNNLHVRGYKEVGNINTPLELAIRNQVDRFNIAIDVIDRVPHLRDRGAHVKEWLKDQIHDHIQYAYQEGIDRPEINQWQWPF